MKFEEAYCVSTGESCTIDDIFRLFITDPRLFTAEYKENFVCPECFKAKLSYNNAAHPYFKAYPKAIHDDDCSLRQDEMIPQQAEEFVNGNENNDAIKRQIESVLTVLLSGKTVSSSKKSLKKHEPFENNEQSVKSKFTALRLPRKRIDIAFRPEDFGYFKLFYGQVKLQWEKANLKKDGFDGYKMLLYHVKLDKLVCKLRISDKVYNHISAEYKSSKEYTCNIVFLALFIRDTGKSYQFTTLRTSEWLKIEKS